MGLIRPVLQKKKKKHLFQNIRHHTHTHVNSTSKKMTSRQEECQEEKVVIKQEQEQEDEGQQPSQTQAREQAQEQVQQQVQQQQHVPVLHISRKDRLILLDLNLTQTKEWWKNPRGEGDATDEQELVKKFILVIKALRSTMAELCTMVPDEKTDTDRVRLICMCYSLLHDMHQL